jgi:hypothetical protein
MTLFMSGAVVVAGLLLALLLDTSGDLQVFGWILVGAGLLGAASWYALSRSGGRDGRPGRFR